MKYIFHTIGHNERWDNIAHKYYGNSYNIAPIIEANPHIAIVDILSEGMEIRIPIDETVKNNDSLLPIWKRSE